MALTGPRRPPKNGKADSLVVLVHGYGADGNDLIGLAAPLAEYLPGAAFVAPDGPEPCPGAGRQWFAITQLDPTVMHQGVLAAAPLLTAFITAELQRLRLPPERLALIGFSQGTMLALQIGLGVLKPAAIVGFSGLLTSDVAPVQDLPPVFLSHGGADELIPPEALFATASLIGAAGGRVQWHLSPQLGHGIDDEGLVRAAEFLKSALEGRFAATGPAMSLMR